MADSKQVLIINRSQFGYHMDSFAHCKHAREVLTLTYLGFDAGKPRITLEGVEVRYISREGSLLRRYLRFVAAAVREARKPYDVVFVRSFMGCAVIALLNRSRPMVCDIRTGSVSPGRLKRWWKDWLLRLESRAFRHVSIISQSLADKLGLRGSKIHLLPLGADPVDVPPKTFTSARLLYVGTLSGRRLEDTIDGFARLHSEQPATAPLTYDVIGDGSGDELNALRERVERLGLNGIVRLPGYIHQEALGPYYCDCTIGISYVPINTIYDCQPPTKTFEYLLAGMPVLATATRENTRLITDSNGVLIRDNAQEFYAGLKRLLQRLDTMDSSAIRKQASPYTWRHIVETHFLPLIQAVSETP